MPNAIQTKLTDYDGFVDKFVPKKTTDDCYTPQAVYDEVPSASCAYVRRLDNMPGKNGLFGAGFLLSDRATAVKLDAERRAREIKELGGGDSSSVVIGLSEREKAVVDIINRQECRQDAQTAKCNEK